MGLRTSPLLPSALVDPERRRGFSKDVCYDYFTDNHLGSGGGTCLRTQKGEGVRVPR